jgi:CBS domain-containing protein
VVIGEIDIDSDRPHAFGSADRAFLEEVAVLLAPSVRSSGQTVANVMLRSPKTLPADASVAEARRLFENRRVGLALLVENDRFFRGALTREDLPADASLEAPALPFARPATPIAADTSADAAFAQISEHPDRRLVVLDEDGETLLGLLCLDAGKTHFCGGAEAYVPSAATAPALDDD